MRKTIFKITALILVLLIGVQTLAACNVNETGDSNDKQAERTLPEWTKDAVIYEVNIRQYTEEGTFKAFSEHLQEIKDLGVTTLWFMPIHPISETNRSGTLGSYYSITDYREVNPEFGTAEDFKELVDTAHDMGFTVMMDWVANHTGWDCEWIAEHPDWYTHDEAGNIISPEGMGWPDVADLNYDSMEMREEMISCMKYWVEEYDIDGFRCDHAKGVPLEFWEEARRELEDIKPLFMLAEDDTYKEYLNEAFDMNYNWGLYDLLVKIAMGTKYADIIKVYIPEDYPEGTFKLNFLDNHDKNSYEHTIIDAVGEDALPAMFALIYTIPGMPLLYNGDEIGYDKNIEFMEKDPIDWDSTEYNYRELLATLASIRSENPALYSGSYGGEINYYESGSKSVMIFEREKEDNIIKCIFNLSKKEKAVNLTEVIDGSESVILQGTEGEVSYSFEDINALDSEEYTMKPWEFIILKSNK